MMDAIEVQTATPSLSLLTDKEREALDGVLQRLSSKEIAQKLGVSPKAIDKRLDSARDKLSSPTRNAAANRYAELSGRWERLPYQPFLLGNDDEVEAGLGGVPAGAVYSFGDAMTFGSGIPWSEGGQAGSAPKFVPLPGNTLQRLVWIVAGAVLILIGIALLLNVTDGLKELIQG